MCVFNVCYVELMAICGHCISELLSFFCSFLPFFKKSTVLVNEWNLIIGLFDIVIDSVLKWDHVYFTPFDDSISASRRVPYACDSNCHVLVFIEN